MRKIDRLRVALQSGAFWGAFRERRPVEDCLFTNKDGSAKNAKSPQKSTALEENIVSPKSTNTT